MLLIVSGTILLALEETDNFDGIFRIAAHLYALVFGFAAITTELSLTATQSRFGPRLVEMFPFLRQRYGRSLFYMVSGLIIFISCFNESPAI